MSIFEGSILFHLAYLNLATLYSYTIENLEVSILNFHKILYLKLIIYCLKLVKVVQEGLKGKVLNIQKPEESNGIDLRDWYGFIKSNDDGRDFIFGLVRDLNFLSHSSIQFLSFQKLY